MSRKIPKNANIIEISSEESDGDADFMSPPTSRTKPAQKKKKQPQMADMFNTSSSSDVQEEIEEVIPAYCIERAKSGRAECKKCDKKIDKNEVRIGVITEGEWGLFTRWQHLACTVFHKSIREPEALDGFLELDKDGKALVTKRVVESEFEIDQDFIPVDPDELVRKDWNQEMEPTEDLLMPLLPYQKEGLGWMLHQEQSEAAGGILADEMGMGKTIQAISLMLSNRFSRQKFDKDLDKRWKESGRQDKVRVSHVQLAVKTWELLKIELLDVPDLNP
jgi:hypothetical protein